ncbi:MAG: SGNH/GDSL hydrolase family protein [Corynebacterium sp.]|uniref:SGNH/GDSL hydrolase family protein n=1 Tax=Corynebacterium sp. TaxID=1720 RepID=UPI003F987E47
MRPSHSRRPARRRRPLGAIVAIVAIAALALPLTLTTAAAQDLSSGSSATSGSSGNGSANLPGSSAVNPSNPYSGDTTDNLVAFGDSFTANSHSVANNIESSAEGYPTQDGCLVAPDAWPGLLAEDSETPVQNWACTNSGTAHMLNRVGRAIDAGDVNNSSTVVLSSGMNDKQRGVSDSEVISNLVASIGKIQDAAPQAEIIVLGRLASTNPDGRLCSVNVIPNLPLGVVNESTAAAEEATQDNQRTAASRTGVDFVDIREKTRENNSTCGRDGERYVAGAFDVTTPQFNMQSHPSRAGSEFLAAEVAGRL